MNFQNLLRFEPGTPYFPDSYELLTIYTFFNPVLFHRDFNIILLVQDRIKEGQPGDSNLIL